MNDFKYVILKSTYTTSQIITSICWPCNAYIDLAQPKEKHVIMSHVLKTIIGLCKNLFMEGVGGKMFGY